MSNYDRLAEQLAWRDGELAKSQGMQRVVPEYYAVRGRSEAWKAGYDGKPLKD